MPKPRRYYLEIFLVSFAALLLEISYTRLISFKLFYYYTYLIIGFALLGIGSGGVFVAISKRLRGIDTDRLLALSCMVGALTVAAGYWVVCKTTINTRGIWTGDAASNVSRLLLICLALFATFIAVGVVVATLFSREPERINRLYFADLLGAGCACALVVPALRLLSPPGTIALGGLALALAGARVAWRSSRGMLASCLAVAALIAVGVASPRSLPEPIADKLKTIRPGTKTLFSKWSPVFRIDVTESMSKKGVRIIHHDGLWGSTLHRFDGNIAALGKKFDTDERSFPYRLLGKPPRKVLIIGAAGGHEILSSLYFRAGQINAVELNPVTASLTTKVFAKYVGHITERKNVNLIIGEGRSYISRDTNRYDLIFFVAPDSYSAMNAATAGAFVLSESYLYTVEMLKTSLQHLSKRGVICMQFGEFFYKRKPNRTARYVGTAREALRQLGAKHPAAHILVATSPSFIELATILLKRTPFTQAEINRFMITASVVRGSKVRHIYGKKLDNGPVNKVLELPRAKLPAFYAKHPYDIRPVFDDAPFFWHFTRFSSVLGGGDGSSVSVDPEDAIGERLLLIMLGIAALFALVFLLLPFFVVRDLWKKLPRKPASAAYFAALGLGFMFFEVCLIQKLTLFLGYPTYSLTVTLMTLLVFSGAGSLLTGRYAHHGKRALIALFVVVLGLTLFYQFGMPAVTRAMLGSSLALRVAIAVLCMAPLGLCLGAFMPLGLTAVSGLSELSNVYVAWGWAVNGFFSVVGSVLTTILSMTYGFKAVLFIGLGVYALALLVLLHLQGATPRPETS